MRLELVNRYTKETKRNEFAKSLILKQEIINVHLLFPNNNR